MLVRKALARNIKQAYYFGVDAKTLTIGVPKEVYPNEKRVAITPDTIQRMVKKHGINFKIESGAGDQAAISDKVYEESGAQIVQTK
jgi:H+-translocating NAD(P) transhydrogenase